MDQSRPASGSKPAPDDHAPAQGEVRQGPGGRAARCRRRERRELLRNVAQNGIGIEQASAERRDPDAEDSQAQLDILLADGLYPERRSLRRRLYELQPRLEGTVVRRPAPGAGA